MLKRVVGLVRVVGSIGAVAMLAVLAGCTSELETRVQDLERENLDLVVESTGLRNEAADAQAKAEALRLQTSRQAAELNSTRSRLQQAEDNARKQAEEVERLVQERDVVEAEPAALVMGPDDEQAALERMVQDFQQGDQVAQTRVDENGNLEITLESDVTFGSGAAALTKIGRQSLRALQDNLAGKYRAYQIRVVGHTDNEPLKRTKAKWGTNWGLGSARAIEVVQFLEQELGIAASRLMSASRGEHDPRADNTTKKSRSRNRRVEIVVIIPRDEVLALAAAK